MPAEYLISYRKKTLVGTFGTFDSRFFANSPHPFIAAGWRIPGPPGLSTFESAWINIFAPTKQGTE